MRTQTLCPLVTVWSLLVASLGACAEQDAAVGESSGAEVMERGSGRGDAGPSAARDADRAGEERAAQSDDDDGDSRAAAAKGGDDADSADAKGGEDQTGAADDEASAAADQRDERDSDPMSDQSREDTEADAERDYPQLPKALSLSGCEGVGPLCEVQQDAAIFKANCAGTHYSGEINREGDVMLSASLPPQGDNAAARTTCAGTFKRGRLQATCMTESAEPESMPGSEATCELTSDPQVLPGVGCMELPSKLSEVILCSDAADRGGKAISAGECSVIQDDCLFQASCADGVVLSGRVSMDGVRFSQPLTALADAEMPEEGEPAFAAGDVVQHTCNATLSDGALSGSCEAGRAGRGGTNTSVCAVVGQAQDKLPSCGLIGPSAEQVFVLDPCYILEEGEVSNPGIGQPACAFRQNNCVWDLQCGRDLKFGGRLEPDATKAEWRLATGTPCQISFDAEGHLTGDCSVPGEPACDLQSIPAMPASEGCPRVLVPDNTFKTRGCGDGSGEGLDCRAYLQNGCDFIAVCGLSSRASNVIAGTASYNEGVVAVDGGPQGQLDFAGLNGFECSVVQPTQDDVDNDQRASNEWHGQCVNPVTEGQCRDNYDPATGEGFRGLQLFVNP